MATSIIWELVELKLVEFLWANDVDQAKDRQKPSSKQTIYRLDIRLVHIFSSVTSCLRAITPILSIGYGFSRLGIKLSYKSTWHKNLNWDAILDVSQN